MTPDLETNASPKLTPLLSGIVSDVQVLLRQHLTLFQTEVKNDLGRARAAAIPLGLGMAVSFMAALFLFLMCAHLLVWIWPQLPLFAAYGLVGVLLGLIGAPLVLVGKGKFEAISLEKSMEGLKEDLQWTTKT